MAISEELSGILTDLIQPLAEALDLELVEITMKQDRKPQVLEVVVDKEGGITVDDCAELSSQISLTLDVEDPIPFKYLLEVGSPGIFRELKTEKEIIKHVNKRVKAVFKSTVKGKKNCIGMLKGFENKMILLSLDNEELAVEYDRIKKIQLYPDI